MKTEDFKGNLDEIIKLVKSGEDHGEEIYILMLQVVHHLIGMHGSVYGPDGVMRMVLDLQINFGLYYKIHPEKLNELLDITKDKYAVQFHQVGKEISK